MENIERELRRAKMQGEEAKKILRECNEISSPPRSDRQSPQRLLSDDDDNTDDDEEPTYVSSLFRLSAINDGEKYAASDSPNKPETPSVTYSPAAIVPRTSPRATPTIYRQTADGKHERYFPLETTKKEVIPPPPQPIRSWETPSPTSTGRHTPPVIGENAKPAPKKVAPLLGKVRHPINTMYQHVEPRYNLPTMSKLKAIGNGPPQRQSDFVALHTKLKHANGYDRAAPRYQEPKNVTPQTEELELPKKRPDKFLKQHQSLRSKLGYDKVQSRLLDGVYGISRSSSCPRSRSARSSRSSTPTQLTRSNSLKKRSSSVMQSPASARTNMSLVSIPDPTTTFTHSCEVSSRGGGGSHVDDLLRSASKKERLGRFSDAEKHHFSALRARREACGDDSESVVWSFMGLGILSTAARNWVAAKIHYKEVIRSCSRLGIKGEVVQEAKQGLGTALFKSESFGESISVFESLLSELSEELTPSSLFVCKVRSLLSEALFKGGRESEAAEIIKLNEAMGYSGSPKPPKRANISF
eukprot:TRINITY_DN6090_c4_g1_i1.p1 TRINITY_DN6090_c4_g1~~TRINITY_DN6090_c4_g1_i1.p1  ORF type:complete len:578 (+),score=105.00 TRINITY_DN6090_c4_g1_i1:155-1735(+)